MSVRTRTLMRSPRTYLIAAIALAALALSLAAARPALAASAEPWWHLEVIPTPTNLPPGGEGVIEVLATNVGDAPVDGKAHPVTVSDILPARLKAEVMVGRAARRSYPIGGGKEFEETTMTCPEPAELKEKQEKNELSCTYKTKLAEFESLMIQIKVKVEAPEEGEPLETELANKAELKGGGGVTPPAETRPLKISSAPVQFGVNRFELKPEEAGGESIASEAGSHPFQITNYLNLNLKLENWPLEQFPKGHMLPSLPALPRDFIFHLPPGVIGNPTAVETCSESDFAAVQNLKNLCPASSVLGVAVLHILEPQTFGDAVLAVPVFNLEPRRAAEGVPGEPARFGFFAAHTLVFIDTEVNSEEEYAATVTVHNASQVAEVLSSIVTFWGDPGNEVHDEARGWLCVEGERYAQSELLTCKPPEPRPTRSFLLLPTTCHKKLSASLEGRSWPAPGAPEGFPLERQEFEIVEEITGCDTLEFNPKIEVVPESHEASTPTALTVKVKVPSEGTVSPEGRAQSAVNATTVKLPDGVVLNPGGGDGLRTCFARAGSPIQQLREEEERDEVGLEAGPPLASQIGNDHFTASTPTCLNQSKVGTVKIKTPLLNHDIDGALYLANENTNPFEPPLVLYLVVDDKPDGILVKLAGTTAVDPNTGQLTSTFENTPQLPFEELVVKFFKGGRSSVSTPPYCGDFITTGSFTPWSTVTPSSPGSPVPVATEPSQPGHEQLLISSGPNKSACTFPGNPLPFAPSLVAGPVPNAEGQGGLNAGQYTDFNVTIKVPDGNQAPKTLSMKLPAGVAAKLATVEPCPAANRDASPPSCPASSLVGETTALAGLGSEPVTLHGNLYLTQGYNGAPFGLLAVTHAVVGPEYAGRRTFNLGEIPIRSTINVDPNTAVVSIDTTDAIPQFVKGAPAQLKELNVRVNRKEFQFNPTNCSPLKIEGQMIGYQGTAGHLESPMQLNGCDKLHFDPGFEAEVEGQGSKEKGVGFKVITTSTGIGVGNIAKVFVALPIQLPSRLSTIQKACLASVFEANPASCPEGSNIGSAHIETPVLKNPLAGPAYLVSHGNAAFPDVEFVLQGEGIKLILDGKTDIKKGITYSRFESTPDAPFTRFETTLPAGPHSALTANVPESKKFNLCGQKLLMPTEITGQNGVLIKQTTRIKIKGCKKVIKHLTRKQKLAKALKECRKHHKKGKKRKACERAARKKYGAKKPAAKHHRK